jgi:hypothetical protein
MQNVATLITMRIVQLSNGFKTLDKNMLIWCPNSSIMARVFGVSRWNLKYTTYYFYHCIYGLLQYVPKKFRKTPSNASNFPKVFRRSHFWTSILSISWKLFESCANSNRINNKINLWNKSEKWKHNGNNNQWHQKMRFFGPKKWHVTYPKKHIFWFLN